MPDSKITALTALTAADPAVDMFPVVDVSDTTMAASGTTKRISINNILACSPVATLASLNVTGSSMPANGLYLPTTNTLEFAANSLAQYRIAPLGVFSWYDGAGGTRMTLNANGLGIGVTPSAWLSNRRALEIGGQAAAVLALNGTAAVAEIYTNSYRNTSGNYIYAQNGYAGYMNYNNQAGGGWAWSLAPSGTAGNAITFTQAMTLDASGNLLTGTTTALASGNTFQNLGTSRQVLSLKGDAFGSYTLGVWNASTTNDGLFQYFATETTLTVRGGISYNRGGGLVAYNTTSDYRAKDIIGPVSNSGSLIDSLKVYVGKMKGATIERPMLIAHEAQEVAPYAVTGTKDEVDSDGKPKYQQMDASALVPLLIAEIQSLRARVQTLETR